MPKFTAGFRFLTSEARTLERAVSILAASALLSSLLALLRDRLLAHTFGAGTELDIYYAAFRIPDLLFVTIGALVSVYILIPELARRDASQQKDYIDTVVVAFSLLAVFASLAAALFAPTLLKSLFPSLDAGGHMEALVTLTRIMLLQPILLGLSNILAAITQIRARYGLYALSPILYNLGIIGGIFLLYPLWGIAGLAWGVVLGAGLHLGIQVPSIIRDGFFHRVPRIIELSALWRTASISVPRALTLSLNQIAFVGLTAFAATLAPGSIAIFIFAFNLNSVPLSVIGVSYSVAAFPMLAAAVSSGRNDEFVQHVAIASRHILFWSLPAVALIVILRAHIVRVVLGSGAFDWTDTRLTAAALAIFSFGLAAQGITLLLVRGYYAC
jgi:putative peptidoglycan lipid II flippase